MSIKVFIHESQRHFANGQTSVAVKGKTVGECLRDLTKQFPKIESGIFDKKGNLHYFVEVFLNQESAYPNELAKKVKNGDEIYLTLALAGG